MSTSEKFFLIFLFLVFVLKALSFIPGAFDKGQTATSFSSWVVVPGTKTSSGSSIWLWLQDKVQKDLWTPYFVLFLAVAISLGFTLFSTVPLFAHAGTFLVFFTFLTTLVTAATTSIYFFYVINHLKYKMTDYNYIGIGMYLFLGAEALELVLLILSVVVYNSQKNSTKWGRF